VLDVSLAIVAFQLEFAENEQVGVVLSMGYYHLVMHTYHSMEGKEDNQGVEHQKTHIQEYLVVQKK
jgi:hypothetical protein